MLGVMAQIPETGLVAYYSFDENITDDKTKNYFNLTSTNRETSFRLNENGKFGKSFLANSQEITDGLYTADTNLQFRTSFSISVWLKIGIGTPDAWGTVICNRKNRQNPIYNNYGLFVRNFGNGDNRIAFTVTDSLLTLPTSIDTSWHHVVVTYNAGYAKIYVDGILKMSGSGFPTSIAYNAPDLGTLEAATQLGNIVGNGASMFQNLIDEVALYNRELSNTEVQNLFNANSNTLVTMAQEWKKVYGNAKMRVSEITAKNSDFIGFIADGENFVYSISANDITSESYNGSSDANYIHLSSNGHALIQNGNSLFYYDGSVSQYTDISANEVTYSAINATTAYKIGGKNTGIYKYANNTWVDVDGTVSASKIYVANDETILILGDEGNPAISSGPNYAFTFQTSLKFVSATVVNANLAYGVVDDGIIYKYTPSTGWTVFNTKPAMGRIAAANDGTLFGLSLGTIYKLDRATTGINQINNTLHFAVYPNPSNDIIQITAQKEIKTITLFDITGVAVKTLQNETTINVSEMSNGIYLLQVTDKDGNTGTQKIIITH